MRIPPLIMVHIREPNSSRDDTFSTAPPPGFDRARCDNVRLRVFPLRALGRQEQPNNGHDFTPPRTPDHIDIPPIPSIDPTADPLRALLCERRTRPVVYLEAQPTRYECPTHPVGDRCPSHGYDLYSATVGPFAVSLPTCHHQRKRATPHTASLACMAFDCLKMNLNNPTSLAPMKRLRPPALPRATIHATPGTHAQTSSTTPRSTGLLPPELPPVEACDHGRVRRMCRLKLGSGTCKN